MAQDIKLPRPKMVFQNAATCWAAALESWLNATPLRPKWTSQILIDTGISLGRVDSNSGALLIPPKSLHFESLMAVLDAPVLQIQMETSIFDNAAQVPDAIGSVFSALVHGRYVYLIFPFGTDVFHTVVVFGIGDVDLHVMDPQRGFLRIDLSTLGVPLIIGRAGGPLDQPPLE
jgi:hypothetical protein